MRIGAPDIKAAGPGLMRVTLDWTRKER